ncbi:unnamed protein product [Peniophora sp. CBMAI 1063]|nr:unnamed protein product [Peniophora sp. CBMAI 1063]
MIPWLFIDCFSLAVNSVVWNGNVIKRIPVWCDIVTKLNVGSTVALPAACLCLTIRLESISACRQVSVSHASRRRWMIFDLVMCFGLPCVYMALHYIVQGHRFDIAEDLGCRATYYVSVPAIFIMFIPPLLLSAATLILGGMALAHFFRRRAVFAQTLKNSQSALTTARYVRLMLMSIVLMIWTLAASTLQVWFSTRYGLRPWTNWADVHSNWTNIGLFPTAFLSPSDRVWSEVVWWTTPLSAMFFAAFFMFGEDALKEYKACWMWIKTHVLRMKPAARSARNYVPAADPPSAYKTHRGTMLSTFSVDGKTDVSSTLAPSYSKPILSSSALKSFAEETQSVNTDWTSDAHSTMPSTPSDYAPPDYAAGNYARRPSQHSINDTHFAKSGDDMA